MRVFIAVIILIFSLQSWTRADDISDFQIEGISIGDSLLDYYSEEEINKSVVDFGEYKKSIFYTKLKTYNSLVGVYIKDDNKYIIKGLFGNLAIYSEISDCYKKMEVIDKEISDLFVNLDRKDWGILESGKKYQTYSPITYDFKNKDRIQIACYDFRKNKNEDNERDLLKLSLYTLEYKTAAQFIAEKTN